MAAESKGESKAKAPVKAPVPEGKEDLRVRFIRNNAVYRSRFWNNGDEVVLVDEKEYTGSTMTYVNRTPPAQLLEHPHKKDSWKGAMLEPGI